jgi:hypothetical protein
VVCGVCSSVGAPIQGRCPASEVNDGAVQKSQTTSLPSCLGFRGLRFNVCDHFGLRLPRS